MEYIILFQISYLIFLINFAIMKFFLTFYQRFGFVVSQKKAKEIMKYLPYFFDLTLFTKFVTYELLEMNTI